MSDKISIVVLAAGEGSRLKLGMPKPLAPLLGQALLDFVLDTVKSFANEREELISLDFVVGHKKELLVEHLNERKNQYDFDIGFVHQENPKGTGDALRCYLSQSKNASNSKYTIILCADTPLIEGGDINCLYEDLSKDDLDGVAATFIEDSPKGYGRIVRSNEGGFHIVEEKDASNDIKKITEVNSALYVFKTSFLLEHINELKSNNKACEFYLTDLFKDQYKVRPILFENKDKFLGINDLSQLERAGALLRERLILQLMSKGVRILDTRSVFIEAGVEVGEGTTLYPNIYLGRGTVIGKNVIVGTGSVLFDSKISDEVEILPYCHLQSAIVESQSAIGPFARLRKGTVVGKNTKIGNFVETKNTILGEKVGISHLSYVGDAEIGKNTNLGCGFITCNYDGENKNLTKIGNDCFIGSDTQMIAPIEIGDSCYIASGSTINQNMEEGSFAVARGRQTTKLGMARRFLKGKWKKS